MFNPTVIFVDLPPAIKGMTVKTFDEEDCFTVVINSKLNFEQQREAYLHELKHMYSRDFDKIDQNVDEIEMIRHYAI